MYKNIQTILLWGLVVTSLCSYSYGLAIEDQKNQESWLPDLAAYFVAGMGTYSGVEGGKLLYEKTVSVHQELKNNIGNCFDGSHLNKEKTKEKHENDPDHVGLNVYEPLKKESLEINKFYLAKKPSGQDADLEYFDIRKSIDDKRLQEALKTPMRQEFWSGVATTAIFGGVTLTIDFNDENYKGLAKLVAFGAGYFSAWGIDSFFVRPG